MIWRHGQLGHASLNIPEIVLANANEFNEEAFFNKFILVNLIMHANYRDISLSSSFLSLHAFRQFINRGSTVYLSSSPGYNLISAANCESVRSSAHFASLKYLFSTSLLTNG